MMNKDNERAELAEARALHDSLVMVGDFSRQHDEDEESDEKTMLSKPTSAKKRKKSEMTEDERKAERRAANRRSAYESRHRRKVR